MVKGSFKTVELRSLSYNRVLSVESNGKGLEANGKSKPGIEYFKRHQHDTYGSDLKTWLWIWMNALSLMKRYIHIQCIFCFLRKIEHSLNKNKEMSEEHSGLSYLWDHAVKKILLFILDLSGSDQESLKTSYGDSSLTIQDVQCKSQRMQCY